MTFHPRDLAPSLSPSSPLLPQRRWMLWAGGGLAMGIYPLLGWADDHDNAEKHGEGSNNGDSQAGAGAASDVALAGNALGNVVVIGGGMAGASAAKYLRFWGGTGLKVTLVEPDAAYTSAIMSNLVLSGARNINTLQFTLDKLVSQYGVVRKKAGLVSINPTAKQVLLSDQSTLSYDRLVLAPGVEFDNAYGLTQADYDTRTPHAWRAGPQTTLLQQQIAGMVNGDTFVMTIPKSPYRCPPGPYERACLVADFLKTRKGPLCKVLVLDENPGIQAEVENFTQAFTTIHAGVIDYQPGATAIEIDPVLRTVRYTNHQGISNLVAAKVINPIPPQRATGSAAGGWLRAAGLSNSADGRWAKVDVLSYESTAVQNIHVIGDAAQCGLPKAGHVGNQEGKICADAIARLLSGQQPDPAPVANSACYSPITASTASWLTAVYQYAPATATTPATMQVAANGGNTVGAKPTEAASISSGNFKQMNTWFTTLMGDTFT